MFKMPKLKIDTNSTLLMIIIVIVVFIGMYVVFFDDNEEVISKIGEVGKIASIPPPSCPDLECPACPEAPTQSCPSCPRQIPCPKPNTFMDIGNAINTKCLDKCRKGNIGDDDIKEQKCIIDCNVELDKLAKRVTKFIVRVEDGETPEDDEEER